MQYTERFLPQRSPLESSENWIVINPAEGIVTEPIVQGNAYKVYTIVRSIQWGGGGSCGASGSNVPIVRISVVTPKLLNDIIPQIRYIPSRLTSFSQPHIILLSHSNNIPFSRIALQALSLIMSHISSDNKDIPANGDRVSEHS